MSQQTPNPPAHTSDPNYTALIREIKSLRRLARQTKRKIALGTLPFHTGATILTGIAIAISRLQLTQHQLMPAMTDPHAEARRKIEAALIDIGLGPRT